MTPFNIDSGKTYWTKELSGMPQLVTYDEFVSLVNKVEELRAMLLSQTDEEQHEGGKEL